MAQIPANPSVDVESLKPFKKFIMTIGNLPTSYLESLSYAELVMWFCNFLQEQVIPAVNNNGDAVEELQGLYVELKNYVDNYFTDLDVQEEINNKLDSMVEDGTLTNLISSYINPYIDEQNNRINNIDRKVNIATSGSPLVASSTSEMTDTTRVYVNTTDGNWYWYNGTSWQIGGVYQSTEFSNYSITSQKLANESITPRKIAEVSDETWFNLFRFCEEYYPNKLYSGGNLVDYTTTPVISTGLVKVNPGSKILVPQILQSPARFVLYDENKNYISQTAFSGIASLNASAHYIGCTIQTENIDLLKNVTCSTGIKNINIPWLNVNEEQIIYESKQTLKGIVFGDSLWANCRGTLNYPNAIYNVDESGKACVGYQQYLQNANIPNYNINITNYAQGGWGTVQWYRETSSNYCIQNITSDFLEQFDFCILAFGTNDATSGERLGTLGTSADDTSSYDDLTFIGAYRHCIDILLSLKPNLKIIMWTPIPKILHIGESNFYAVDTPNSRGDTMNDFCKAIKDIANLYSFPVVDMLNNVNINKFNVDKFTFEGVHLTNPGYAWCKDYFVNETVKYLTSNID